MHEDQYVKSKEIRKKYRVHPSTLRNWAKKGLVAFKKTPGDRYLFKTKDVEKLFGDTDESTKEVLLYARVSSSKQKEDLERQVDSLLSKFPGSRLLKDVGSGLNFKRKGFKTLLDLIMQGNISTLVVTYRDRLCRFGLPMLEQILELKGTRLMVLNQNGQTRQEELKDDLISICTYFTAQAHGRRSHKNKNHRVKTISKADQDQKELDGYMSMDL